MNKTCSILFLLISFSFFQVDAQILKGKVIDKFSNDPVADADVTLFGIRKTSSSFGEIEINVTDFYAPGNLANVSIYHKDYGMNTISYTFPSDLRNTVIFEIERTPNIGFLGLVKDRATGQAINGIEVSIATRAFKSGIKSPVVVSDKFGSFNITISNRAFTEEVKYARLLFHDPQQRFKDYQEVVNISDLNIFELEKGRSPSSKFKIKGLSEVEFEAPIGAIISIRAGGSIKVGEFVGTSTPEGRPSGVLGLSLSSYNIVPSISHAALMYKLDNGSNWAYCGTECQFISTKNGKQKIIFEVNDNNQTDNYGSYDIEIIVEN